MIQNPCPSPCVVHWEVGAGESARYYWTAASSGAAEYKGNCESQHLSQSFIQSQNSSVQNIVRLLLYK